MINTQLVYLMSSLPYLYFSDDLDLQNRVSATFRKYGGEEAKERPILAIFETEAEKFLSHHHYQTLRELNLNKLSQKHFQNNENRVTSTFSKYFLELKTAVINTQITKLKNPVQVSGEILMTAETIKGNPLQKELQFRKHLWQKLEDLDADYHFQLESLLIYKLQLQLLLEWWKFDSQKGFANFQNALKD